MTLQSDPGRGDDFRDVARPARRGLGNPDRDWTQEEMSGLRRVVGALAAAAVPASLRCGRSAAGTPWGLVCESGSGRVLLHVTLARGTYQLVAWNLSAPIRSPDLAAILRLAAENGQEAAKVSDRITWNAPASRYSTPAARQAAVER